MAKITVLSNGSTYGDSTRVMVRDQVFDYSWQMMNPHQLVELLQFIGHEVDWNNEYKFED